MTSEQQAKLRADLAARFDSIYGADEDSAFAEMAKVPPMYKKPACPCGFDLKTHLIEGTGDCWRAECACRWPRT